MGRRLIASYTEIPVDQIGNWTKLGPGFRNIIAKMQLALNREPMPDRPPSPETTLAELVGMFTPLEPSESRTPRETQ